MEYRYASGELAGLGDKVGIDSGATGVVVGLVDTGQYSEAYNKEHWDHYGTGVLVESAAFGLIFYQEADKFAALRKTELRCAISH